MQQYLEDSHKGKDISEIKVDFKLPEVKKRTPHQVLVDAILEATGEPQTSYGRWIGLISRSKLSMNEVLDLCKVAKSLPDKYNKSGYIMNRL